MKYWQTRVMTSSVDGWRHQICYSTKKFILSWSLFLVYAYLNDGDKKLILKKRGRGRSLVPFFWFFYPLKKKKIGSRFFPFFLESPFFRRRESLFWCNLRASDFFFKALFLLLFLIKDTIFYNPPVIFPPASFFFLSCTPSRYKF